jgi:uncharacterized membrane protein YphA (DoxX/SURF4 family)
MKYIFTALITTLVPTLALAHTKWFAEGDLPPLTTNEPTGLYLGVWAAVLLAIVLCGVYIEKHKWFTFSFLQPVKPHVFERAASTFVMVTGTFFLIAGTHEYLFSPNQTIEAGIPMALVIIQILIGFAFLLGIASRVSGIVLALLWAVSIQYVGLLAALENIWVLTTAIFITLMGNEYFSIISFSSLRTIVAPYKKYALSILRLGTGVTLMVLGLSEKILAPELGTNFLSLHHWNFMHELGLPFSDYLFTLSAGSVELLFGLIFVLGIATRLNALVVAVVFSIPLFILGPIELAGHLPHFAAIVLLLLFGNGGHFTFFSHLTRNK